MPTETPTLLFVHGTGVRKDAYEASLALIREQLHKTLPAWPVEGCLWGDHYGAQFNDTVLSIPNFHETGGRPSASSVGEPKTEMSDEEAEVARWESISVDPLSELALVAMRPIDLDEEDAINPTGFSPGDKLNKTFERLDLTTGEVALLFRTGDISDTVEGARHFLL